MDKEEKITRQLSEIEYMEFIEKWKIEHKELIESGKCRKCFVECLPKGKSQIRWKECIDNKIYFIYENISGWLNIIKCFRKNGRTRLFIEYNNKEFDLTTSSLTSCLLGNFLDIYTDDFKYEIGQIFKDNKRDITITDRKYVNNVDNEKGWITKYKYYQYKCNKCGFDCGKHYKNQELKDEFWIIETDLKHGAGCSCCCNPSQIVVDGINNIPTTNPEMVKYFQGGYDEAKLYNRTSNKKINPICPDCGRVKDNMIQISDIYLRKTISCFCSDNISYSNKFASIMLKQLNVEFKTEYSPKWIKPKAYDFYFKLNNKEYILEMDGEFHYKNNNMNGQTIEESKAIDNYKDEQAKLYGIQVIRIDCDYKSKNRFAHVKENILNNNKLNELFDLSRVDWDKCNEYALSNLVKLSCDYWKNNPNITTKEIAKIMKLHNNTIIKYLKQGNGIWCDYIFEEEKTKNIQKRANKQKKAIICIDNLKIFHSIKECCELSMDVFGVNLGKIGISTVCKGRQKTHYGFRFKHISSLTEEEYIKYDIKNKLKELNKTA